MDLRVLQYLVDIVSFGGFGKAAEVIHLSQPALSKAIQGLESEVGVVLLERGGRGTPVKLTPAGKLVHEHAKALLQGRDKMIGELKSLDGLESGELKICLSPLGSAEIFAPVIARFRETYPNVRIHLIEKAGTEQEEALLRGEVELATGLAGSSEEIERLQLLDETLVLALPQGHPLLAWKSIKLDELCGVPLVGFEKGFFLSQLIRDACNKKGFEPQIVTEITHADFGLALVAGGQGAMLLPRMVAERQQVESVSIRPLESTSLRWSLSLIWRKKGRLSSAARVMKEMIAESLTTRA